MTISQFCYILYGKFDVFSHRIVPVRKDVRTNAETAFFTENLKILHEPVRLHRLSNCKGVCPVSFTDSLLVALFLMAIVFVALFALYLFVTLFSLIVETAEHAAKHKKAAQ